MDTFTHRYTKSYSYCHMCISSSNRFNLLKCVRSNSKKPIVIVMRQRAAFYSLLKYSYKLNIYYQFTMTIDHTVNIVYYYY